MSQRQPFLYCLLCFISIFWSDCWNHPALKPLRAKWSR